MIDKDQQIEEEKVQAFVDRMMEGVDVKHPTVVIPTKAIPTTRESLSEMFTKIRKDFKNLEVLRREFPIKTVEKNFTVSLGCIMENVRQELDGARSKFPDDEKLLHAMQEEAGEVTREFLQEHYGKGSNQQVYKELIQTIAMCVRLIQEGDPEFNFIPDQEEYYQNYEPTQ